MKDVKHNIRIVIEPHETEDTALARAKRQLKLNDTDLENYNIHFYREEPIKRTFKNLIGKAL